MRRFTRVLLTSLLAAGLGGSKSATDIVEAPVEPELTVEPDTIYMRAFYDGATIHISGRVREGSEAIVVIRGPHDEELFNKKVRYGPIWVSSGKVEISRAPSLFFAFPSRPPETFLSRETIDAYELDETAVRDEMRVDAFGEEVDEALMRQHFFNLKRQQGLYETFDGVLKLVPAGDGTAAFSFDFHWPKTAPPDTYEIELYELRDGEVTGEAGQTLKLVLTGFPGFIHSLAMEKARWYGLFAVLFAVSFGLGIDYLARKIFGGVARAH